MAALGCTLLAPPAGANYYGIAESDGNNYGALVGDLWSTQLSNNGRSGDFADNDVWIGNSNPNVWVEGGLIQGNWCSNASPPTGSTCSGSSSASTISYFAGAANGSVYQGHQGPSVSYGAKYTEHNYYVSSGTWAVNLEPDGGGNPTWAYNFTNPFGGSNGGTTMQTGTEEVSQADTACSHQMYLSRYNGNGNYSSWTNTYVPYSQNPPFIVTLTTNSSYREYSNAPGCS